jgi:2-keto-4-pentenoate hydratase/2-oxohepta-3-ene-1,7-dioic acid hydratase in catechol pathway
LERLSVRQRPVLDDEKGDRMKIVRFAKNRAMKYGVLNEDEIVAVSGSPFPHPGRPGDSPRLTNETHNPKNVVFLAPCLPSKIVAVGLNYRKHAEERNVPIPDHPLIFLKPSTSVIGTEGKIIYPGASKRVDYEGELAVVIGRKAKAVDRTRAKEYIWGYTCLNDVSARQEMADDAGQVTRSKSYDTFAPIGPWIETDISPDDLRIETYLNGKAVQSARTNDLIFPVDVLVSFISGVMTLLPGDVISTGTPSGTGTPEGAGAMKAGDIVEVRIEGIGTLRNYVVEQK